MQQEDPMCWQAWQDNPNAMWNWNGPLPQRPRRQLPGRGLPDWKLCSGKPDRERPVPFPWTSPARGT